MLVPQKAADRAGVSRKTIMDAIKTQKLYAIRDNGNRWQIKEDDLAQWIGDRSGRVVSPPPTNTSVEVSLVTERLVAAEAHAARLEALLEKQEADFRERLSQRDEDYRGAMALLEEAQRPRGLIEILMGRKDKSPG